MARLSLRFDFPTDSWLGDTSRTHPGATLRATETTPAADGAVTALSIAGADREAAVETLREHDRVDRVDLVDRAGPVTRVRVVASAPLQHVAAARAVGLPIAESVAVTDGRATLTVAGDRARLTAFGRRLTDAGREVSIEGSTAGEAPVLTDAQCELVADAVAAGYYDTPRACTLTELADAHDIAKSTCSETLHRAEGRVMRRFIGDEHDDGCVTPRDRTAEPSDATGSIGDDERDAGPDRPESAETVTTEP